MKLLLVVVVVATCVVGNVDVKGQLQNEKVLLDGSNMKITPEIKSEEDIKRQFFWDNPDLVQEIFFKRNDDDRKFYNDRGIENLGDLEILFNMILDNPRHPMRSILLYYIKNINKFLNTKIWWLQSLEYLLNKGHLHSSDNQVF